MSGTTQIIDVSCGIAINAPIGSVLHVVRNGEGRYICIGVASAPAPVPGQKALPAPKKLTGGLIPSGEHETDKRILAALRENGPLTSEQIADRMGVDLKDKQGRSHIGYRLRARLLHDGFVVRRKSDRNKMFPRYEIIERPEKPMEAA
jgi:hypothetical protein